MKLPILTLFLLFSCFHLSYSTPQQYTSIFSFGDSLADTGNFLHSGAVFFHSFTNLPYGMTYFGHPTGRCSDGRLIVDFIAEAFGLPLLPPYLVHGQNFRQGVNFAVAGATALDPSFFRERGAGSFLWTNMSLSNQLDWFAELKPSLCNTTKDCNDYFSRSLFLVGEIGGNDYNYAFFTGKSIEEVKTYVPEVVETIVTSAQKLIDQGAVDLIVPGNLPVGCSAAYLTLFTSPNKEDYDPRNGCLKRYNDFARYHNAFLRRALQQLREKNPRGRIIYASYYGAAMRFVHSPRHFEEGWGVEKSQIDNCTIIYGGDQTMRTTEGFSMPLLRFNHGALTTCCGGGGLYNFNVTASCGQPGSSVCSDPSSYVNWDGIHLTEAAYRNIANGLLQGPYANPPIMRHLPSQPQQ